MCACGEDGGGCRGHGFPLDMLNVGRSGDTQGETLGAS